MFLSNFSIKRPVATVVMVIGLMLVGLLALSKLKVNQFPEVEQPVLVINIPYPGASPETSEREVVNRIEKALQSISGVDRLQLHVARRQRHDRAGLRFLEEHDRGRRRGAQRHRFGALQSCPPRSASPSSRGPTQALSPSCSSRCPAPR